MNKMKKTVKMSEFFDVFNIFFIFQMIASANGKSSWIYANEVEAKVCYNPNNNLGLCMPLKECAAFEYVLRHNLQTNFRFFLASQCERESGDPPFVCCTNDIQFKQQKLRRVQRIVFPDEVEKFKGAGRSDENVESMSQRSSSDRTVLKKTESTDENRMDSDYTTSTQRTVLTKVESAEYPESVITSNNSESTELLEIHEFDSFPKPPKCGRIDVANKIYGGEDAELSEFSWMVILEYRNQTTGKLLIDCAGSLINKDFVLTAAHCVQGDILRSIGKLESVRIGDHNTDTETDCDDMGGCREPFQRIAVESVVPHAGFSYKSSLGTRNQHDIALIRLKKSVKFNDNLQPVCLPNVVQLRQLKEPTKFVVAGWGHNGTMVRTAIKQKLELPLVDHEKCRKAYGKKFYLADEQICAGGRFRQDSCNGDSGGPLMRLNKDFWIIEGIVSFGLKCGLEQPGVYTNVRHYLDWIKENIKVTH